MRTEPKTPSFRWPGLAVLACLWAVCASAAAQEEPWSLISAYTYSREDNLLRLAEGQAAPAGYSRDDTVVGRSVRGHLNLALSGQRLQAQASVRDSRYERNTRYDHQGHAASLALDWTATRRIGGRLSAGLGRQLALISPDVIGLLEEKNFEEQRDLGFEWRVSPLVDWSLTLAVRELRLRNTLDRIEIRSRDLDQSERSASLGFRSPAGFEATLGWTDAQRSYPQLAIGPERADRHATEGLAGSARWQPGAATVWEARVSRQRLRFESGSSRDRDQSSAELTWRWQPRAKLGWVARLAHEDSQDGFLLRDLGPLGVRQLQSDRRSARSASLRADWTPSARWLLKLELTQGDRDITRSLLRADTAATLAELRGSDDSRLLNLGLRWSARRWLQTGCDLSLDSRMGDDVVSTTRDLGSFGCYLQLSLS